MAAGGNAHLRVIDHQRDMRDLIEKRHSVFGPPVMFTQQKAMIGGQNNRCILP